MSTPGSPSNILLITDQAELVQWFLDDVAAQPDESGGHHFLIGEDKVHLRVLTAPPGTNPGDQDPLQDVGILLCLTRFVDVISIVEMTKILKALPQEWHLPTGMLIYRKEGETDFKMSCPYCGQKIWVRDADVDKRGRCPNCKKGFTLPAQDDHVTHSLQLKGSVLVRRVEHRNPGSISGPLRSLLRMRESSLRLQAASTGDAPRKSAATMNVHVEEDTGELPG